MDPLPCVLQVHQGGSRVTVQLRGRATMHQALALRRFGEEQIALGVPEFHLDLRHCSHLDSTMFGTLLCLKRSMDQRGQGVVVLASPSPESIRLLRQMGIEEVLPTVSAEELAETCWSPLAVEPPSRQLFKRHVLECHEALARAGGDEQVRLAVECLSKEVT